VSLNKTALTTAELETGVAESKLTTTSGGETYSSDRFLLSFTLIEITCPATICGFTTDTSTAFPLIDNGFVDTAGVV